jgi:hypothetical protein
MDPYGTVPNIVSEIQPIQPHPPTETAPIHVTTDCFQQVSETCVPITPGRSSIETSDVLNRPGAVTTDFFDAVGTMRTEAFLFPDMVGALSLQEPGFGPGTQPDTNKAATSGTQVNPDDESTKRVNDLSQLTPSSLHPENGHSLSKATG